jgi:hypothetical protein
LSASDVPTGCDVELAELVLAGLGVDDIEWVLVTFDELIPGVRSGRWHLHSPMFISDERAALVRFTVPVWAVTDGFIVRPEDRRDLPSYEAIAADESIILGVVNGQVQHETALSIGVPENRMARHGPVLSIHQGRTAGIPGPRHWITTAGGGNQRSARGRPTGPHGGVMESSQTR